MMMMQGGNAPPQPRAYCGREEPTETISISIGLGSDGRSSSIVLPRGHDLVKHLERLIPATTAPAAPVYSQQSQVQVQLQHPQQVVQPVATRYETSPSYQQLQRQAAPISSMSQYIRANSRYETSTSPVVGTVRAHSPYQSDSSSSVPVYHTTGARKQLQQPQEQPLTRTRRRRGAGSSSSSKKCQFAGCDKISVSRGLCRGHGGGRRCQHVGCTKGAQSRSDFCWAHGGGQRCEVKGCRRSRKSKHFCVAHLDWEFSAVPPPMDNATASLPGVLPSRYESTPRQTIELPKMLKPKTPSPVDGSSPLLAGLGSPRLPSLEQALRNTKQSSLAVRS